MKAFNLIYLLSIFLSSAIYSQDTIREYFDNNWDEITNIENASFYRKAFKDSNNVWIVYDYYISGKIQMTSSFQSNKFSKQQGHTMYFFENGQKKSEGDYINDLRVGEWNWWYETGELLEKGHYEKGNSIGAWQGWYKNGQLAFLGNYKDDKKVSIWEYFYESGELRRKSNYTNYPTILSEGFHKNGVKSYSGELSSGRKTGEWVQWNEEGRKLSEGYFKNGLKEGLWIRYFKEGKLELLYKKGVQKGDQEYGGMIRKD